MAGLDRRRTLLAELVIAGRRPFTAATLLAQVGVITALAALGGLARQLWYGDYGHPAIHLAAALMGAAAVVFVVL